MARTFDAIDDDLRAFIEGQHVFFIATAPRDPEGLVNLSPKGLDCLRVLDERRVAYLDLTGSGVETIAHLKDCGRYVVMFCAFEGRPRIVRLHGHGRAIEAGDGEFATLRPLFPDHPGVRAIIELEVERIADSCGFAVPRYDYQGQRDQLLRYAESMGIDKMREAQRAHNLKSLDGLPGLREPSV